MLCKLIVGRYTRIGNGGLQAGQWSRILSRWILRFDLGTSNGLRFLLCIPWISAAEFCLALCMVRLHQPSGISSMVWFQIESTVAMDAKCLGSNSMDCCESCPPPIARIGRCFGFDGLPRLDACQVSGNRSILAWYCVEANGISSVARMSTCFRIYTR